MGSTLSYISMKKGFMYLTATIDVYSRFIVRWQVSNSLEEATQTELLNESIERYGKPEIINSDQGSQYTSKNWINCLKGHKIRISMDGKGRATDNIYVERFFRSIKYRSEEHTSELQSRGHLVCRLLLEKKKRPHVH